MGAITGTLALGTELSGDYKIYIITATIAAASDVITLTQAVHGISEIAGLIGAVVTDGLDAAFSTIQVSFTGLAITIVSLKADGTSADDFTNTTVSISLAGRSE